jgi:hypothetical protein
MISIDNSINEVWMLIEERIENLKAGRWKMENGQ